MRASVVSVILGLVVGGGAGCSAIFVDSPSVVPGSSGDYIECTDSRVWPWVDTYLASSYTITSIAVAAKPCSGEELGCIQRLALLPLVPAAIGYGISAIWGHSTVSGCKSLQAKAAAARLPAVTPVLAPAPTPAPSSPPHP